MTSDILLIIYAQGIVSWLEIMQNRLNGPHFIMEENYKQDFQNTVI